MDRPSVLKQNNTLYWVILLFDSGGEAVDASSTPTVAIRKNGASTADSVTVTKRASTTGIYDCSYNPASEVEGDQFTVEELATISSVNYRNSWEFTVIAAERGTDNASTFNHSSNQVTVATNNDKTGYALSTAGVAAIEAALLNEGDGQALVAAIIARIETDLDGSDLSVAAIATAVRNAILDRVLSGNHETAGTPGKLLQNLDAPVSDLPTNAELTTALGTADDATLAAIAALNNLSTVQVQSAATAALAAYDPPTNAEMEARTLPAANYATAANLLTADGKLDSLLGRITAGVGTLFTNLIAMITGTGASAKFTVTAMENAPAGGAGGSVNIQTESTVINSEG